MSDTFYNSVDGVGLTSFTNVATTASGPYVSPQSCSFDYAKDGIIVYFRLNLIAIANPLSTSAPISITALLPSGFRPSVNFTIPVPVYNNGPQLGYMEIDPTGTITIYGDTAFGNFNTTGTGGVIRHFSTFFYTI